jgi:disulfide bond formation protein DsbB
MPRRGITLRRAAIITAPVQSTALLRRCITGITHAITAAVAGNTPSATVTAHDAIAFHLNQQPYFLP